MSKKLYAEYLRKDERGTIYCVTASSAEAPTESFRMFKGDGEVMVEVSIKSVVRSYESGNTYIYLEEGDVFYAPIKALQTHLNYPRWNSHELTRLNRNQYDVLEETDGSVKVVKK